MASEQALAIVPSWTGRQWNVGAQTLLAALLVHCEDRLEQIYQLLDDEAARVVAGRLLADLPETRWASRMLSDPDDRAFQGRLLATIRSALDEGGAGARTG